MKVLVLQGGLTSYFRLLLERLNALPGIEVALLIPEGEGTSVGAGVQTESGLETGSFPIFREKEYKAWYGKAFIHGLEKACAQFAPDLIMCGYPYMIGFALMPRLYKRLRKRGIGFVYRDIPWNIPFYGKAKAYFRQSRNRTESDGENGRGFVGLVKFLLLTEVRKRYLKLADAHIYYTDEAKEIIGSYGIQPEKIFISANSPDTDIFLNIRKELLDQGVPEMEPFRIIHIGRLVKWKRVDLIIDAMASLQGRFPKLELLVAGFGPEEDSLRQLARSKGLEKRVQFLGGVYDPRELGRHLLGASVYVLAGMGGLSINDAMCFGRAVICSEADGTEKRLVRENENGLYFTNGSSASLAEKISVLLGDPAKCRRFGERSLEIIETEVNIHTVIRQYDEAFRFALNARGKLEAIKNEHGKKLQA